MAPALRRLMLPVSISHLDLYYGAAAVQYSKALPRLHLPLRRKSDLDKALQAFKMAIKTLSRNWPG